MEVIYIALGSNLGNRAENLENAVAALKGVGAVCAQSQVYETAPLYVIDQPAYLESVVLKIDRCIFLLNSRFPLEFTLTQVGANDVQSTLLTLHVRYSNFKTKLPAAKTTAIQRTSTS